MRPGARVAAAIEVLDEWLAGSERMEAILRRWGRANRYAGSKDRRAIADIAYECLRRRRSFAWLAGGGESGRALCIGRALAHGDDAGTDFDGTGHSPAPLSPAERERCADVLSMGVAEALSPAPDAVRLDASDWLLEPLRSSLGENFVASMEALKDQAPIDLRVNRLKATRDVVLSRLSAGQPALNGSALSFSEDAIRLPAGVNIASHPVFLEGLVELQDVSSQQGAAFAAPVPGETVLDYCAGGGGKSLAIASLMKGVGRVVAHDIAPQRMADLPMRAERAGARIEIARSGSLTPLMGQCDLVFVDAPCSGLGTVRRDPEAKWRLTPDRLEELRRHQADALRRAADYVRKGGRLAYATCSVLTAENDDQVDRFLGEISAFHLLKKRLWSPSGGGDGFFCAVLERSA